MALATTQISTTLVKNALTESSNAISDLCKSSAINMWSRWKPVSYNKNAGLVLSDLQSVNFGIAITQEFMNDTAWIAGRAWSYTKPTGATGAPCRLGDFRGYEHTAEAPYTSLWSGTINVNTTGSTHTFDLTLNSAAPSGSVAYSDLKAGSTSFANCYFGVVAYDITLGVIALVKTSSATLGTGSGSASVTIDTDQLDGDYKLAYFVSNWSQTTQLTYPTSGELPTSDFYILHNGVVSLTVVNNLSSIVFPYYFWNYANFDENDTTFDTEAYTVTTNNGASIIGYSTGARLIEPSGTNRGRMQLTPTELMDDFSSVRKRLTIDTYSGGIGDYRPYSNSDSFFSLLQFTDIDNSPVDVLVRVHAEYDSEAEGWYWGYYIGFYEDLGGSYQEQYIGQSWELDAGGSSYLDLSKFIIEHNVTSGNVTGVRADAYIGAEETPTATSTLTGFQMMDSGNFIIGGASAIYYNSSPYTTEYLYTGEYEIEFVSESL